MLERIQGGEQAAFGELVERYRSKVFRAVYGILRNRQDAEEVAQEVFTKVYFSIPRFESRGSLGGWIHRIAVNESCALMRKRRVKLLYETDNPLDTPGIDLRSVSDGRPAADHTLAQKDLVNHLLARIPDGDRLLLLCRAVDGLSVLELAELTGLSESNLKIRLFRARRKLAELATALSRPDGRYVESNA